MSLKKARKAIREIAKRNGITEKEVVAEIERAIAEAIKNAEEENDKTVLAKWKKIPCKGDMPNAYELIAYLAETVKREEGALLS